MSPLLILSVISQTLHDVMDKEPCAFLMRGVLGVSATSLGVITSLQEHFEWGVRIAASSVGLVIGVLTLVSMVKKLRGVKRDDDPE